MEKKIKVLVVDDSAVFRNIISTVLATDNSVEVVGKAINGAIALEKIPRVKPDVITMDIEMPEMDGITALRKIRKLYPTIAVIMLSMHTERGAEMTVEALTAGAADFIAKPTAGKSLAENSEQIKNDLLVKIKTCKGVRSIQKPTTQKTVIRPLPTKTPVTRSQRDVIAIGSSTGGPDALKEVITRIPKDIKSAILIVQHMPPVFTDKLAQHLNKLSQIEVREAKEGDTLENGLALIAPGGHHMVVKKSATGNYTISLNQDPPENHCRPSADVLFRSVAQHFKGKTVGVILTGMGSDGCKGLTVMKEHGTPIIAQDKDSCVVWGMPRCVVEAGLADAEVDIKGIANKINQYIL